MTANQPPPPPSGGEQPRYGTGPQPGAGQPGWGQHPPPGWGQPPAPDQPGHAASGSGPAYGVPEGHSGHGAPPPPPPPGYAQQPYGQQPAYGQPVHGQQAGHHAGAAGAGSKVDLKRLRVADYVVAGGALVYLVLALLPWVDFGDYFDVDIPGDSISGFSFSGLVSFSFILFLLAAAWAVLPAFADVKLGFPHSWVTVGLAGLGLLLTLVAWIQTLQYGFEICPLLALLVAAAITVFAVLRLLPELRNRPALPGSVAGAAQWANQPAAGVPGTGSPGAPPAQSYGGQPPAAQPYVQPQASPYGRPGGGPSVTGTATPPTAPQTTPMPSVAPGTAAPPPPPPGGGSSTGSTAAGSDPSAAGGEPPRPGA